MYVNNIRNNNICRKRWLVILIAFLLIIQQFMVVNVYADSAGPGLWVVRNPLPTDSNIYEICYGNDTYVAVGSSSTILTSTDGEAWQGRSLDEVMWKGARLGVDIDIEINGVCYGNGIFAAVTKEGVILTSTDGVTWQSHDSGATTAFSRVSYGNNTFVAVGSNSEIVTSADGGVTWDTHDSGSGGLFDGVCYGNGTFVAAGDNGKILTSADGVAWVPQASGTADELRDVRFINNTFVAVGDNETILTSPDGITWTSRNYDAGYSTTLYGVGYGNGTYVAAGGYGEILISADGVTWTNHNHFQSSYHFRNVSYINGNFLLAGLGGVILSSTDGLNWTNKGTVISSSLYSISYGNSKYTAVGSYGIVVTSPDGVTWTLQDSGTENELDSIVYNGSIFTSVGEGGTILTSSDGVTWTGQVSGTSNDLYGVCYGNGTFAAVGDSGTILTSPDGLTWTDQTLADTSIYFSGISYGNNTFVAIGYDGDDMDVILYSTDNGVTWTKEMPGTDDWLNSISFANNTFIIAKDNGTILSSMDGIDWTSREVAAGESLYKVDYGGNTYMAVGDHNASLTSSDGAAWTSQNAGLMYYCLYDIIYANNSFMAVGQHGLILQFYAPTISDVTVSPSNPAVAKGATQQFSVAVAGQYNPAQTVTWDVTGEASADTLIDDTGLLTVAPDETSSSLTVTAVSTIDNTKSGAAAVTVAEKLTTPTVLVWDGTIPGKATWSPVSDASSYSVQLKRDGNNLGSEVIVNSGTEYDFTSVITASGTYTFTITAIGDGTSYISSDSSSPSEGYIYTAPTPGGSIGSSSGDSGIATAGSVASRGIITDYVTGKPISEVDITFYYANTERNIAKGRIPDTVYFKSNRSIGSSLTDASRTYGFMVAQNADYYIVASKNGYETYRSPVISVEYDTVNWNIKMHKPVTGIRRLSGLSRVDTSLEIAKANYSGKFLNVVLATADNYPDALTGAVLAYKIDAPILLVGNSDSDQEKVLSFIKLSMNTAGKVYILGGTGAVSSTMEKKIESAGFKNIVRLSGMNRYETAVKIAESMDINTGTPIVLVDGENYPDALSISSAAAVMQMPILPVQKDEINNEVEKQIVKIKPVKVYIIGLQGSVSAEVEEQVAQLTSLDKANIVRIGGQDRFKTSIVVAKHFNLPGQNICVATGNNFPDALSGSVYAASFNTSIILIDGTLSGDAVNYLRMRKTAGAIIFGGEGAVNKNIEQELKQLTE